MTEPQTLEERVAKLEARNRRVEADKAWEISWARRFAIMVLIYITVAFYLHFVIHIDPWINALVPVIGYTVSTFTIGFLKKRWTTARNR
jgi:hypothetical protein